MPMTTARRFPRHAPAFLFAALTLGGCSAPPGGEGSPEDVGQTESAMYVACNTGPYFHPCLPDLLISQEYAEIWAPGNAQDIYPGTYITWVVKNGGAAAAGAFTVVVEDYYKNVLKTVNVPGLGINQTTNVMIVAPYYDGWTRTIVVDSTNAVAESNESNNTETWATGLDGSPP